MSRLIVNADDLGYTDGINRAVAALHAAGALSSATLMATGASPPPQLPATLGIGCHLVLVDGRPAAPAADIASLLAPDGGIFRPSLARFALDLALGRIHDREIEIEALAQIRAVQARGIRVTHVDTHKHTHMFPRVLRPVLRAALQCGVTAIRNPFEPAWARALTRAAPAVRRLEVALLASYRRGFLREVARAGMRTTAGAIGVLATGSLNGEVLGPLLDAVACHGGPDACYELVCHPGLADAALAALPTRLQGQRETERAALLAQVPAWVAHSGRLIRFDQL